MPILHAIVLGITQGLSEFLPISSSGHLRLVPWLFDWNDFVGQESLEKTFDVALHLGTLLALLVYFRGDIVRLTRAGLRRGALATADGRQAWFVLASAVPAGITGALFSSAIEEHTGAIWLIATMLIVFGLVLAWADRRVGGRAIEEVTLRDAVLMGVGQAVALQPGVSRSGITMTAGRLAGLDRDAAVRFAFLMSIPVTAGAMAFKGLDVVKDGMPDGFAAPFAWGIVASAITGWIAVAGMLRLMRTTTFRPFVIYRLAAGIGFFTFYFVR